MEPKVLLKLTIWVERFSVRSPLGKHNGADNRGGAGVKEHVGLLVAGVGGEQVLDELVLDKPWLGPDVEPDEDVCQGLEEEEWHQGEHRDEGEQVSGWFPLGQLIMGRCVPDQEDGDSSEADVSHKVLVIARLSPNLK